jgi:hypothetical protein
VLAVRTVMLVVGAVAASVWIGSFVCLAVVARIARRALDRRSSVVLFREVGRAYRILGTAALLVAIGMGLALAWPIPTTRLAVAIVSTAAVLVALTGAGMAQAHRMTARRLHALRHPDDVVAVRLVHRGAVAAAVLRGLIGVSTLLIVVFAAALVEW